MKTTMVLEYFSIQFSFLKSPLKYIGANVVFLEMITLWSWQRGKEQTDWQAAVLTARWPVLNGSEYITLCEDSQVTSGPMTQQALPIPICSP